MTRSTAAYGQSIAWLLFLALIGAWIAFSGWAHAQSWTDLLPLAALFAAVYAVLCEHRLTR
jgi:drug/metabolite transporter (DMT)-like permease